MDDHRLVGEVDDRLGHRQGEWPEPCAVASHQDQSLHGCQMTDDAMRSVIGGEYEPSIASNTPQRNSVYCPSIPPIDRRLWCVIDSQVCNVRLPCTSNAVHCKKTGEGVTTCPVRLHARFPRHICCPPTPLPRPPATTSPAGTPCISIAGCGYKNSVRVTHRLLAHRSGLRRPAQR